MFDAQCLYIRKELLIAQCVSVIMSILEQSTVIAESCFVLEPFVVIKNCHCIFTFEMFALMVQCQCIFMWNCFDCTVSLCHYIGTILL